MVLYQAPGCCSQRQARFQREFLLQMPYLLSYTQQASFLLYDGLMHRL
jgi:hypothetical protein